MSNWGEKGYNFLKEVTELTSSVKTLQDQMDRALDQIEKSRDEIRDLRSDMRVLEKEIQVKAMETVVSAHTQIIERVMKLEQGLSSASDVLQIAQQKSSSNGDGNDNVQKIDQES